MGISANNNEPLDRSVNLLLIFLPIIMFALTALRTPGSASTEKNKKKAEMIYEQRPYL